LRPAAGVEVVLDVVFEVPGGLVYSGHGLVAVSSAAAVVSVSLSVIWLMVFTS